MPATEQDGEYMRRALRIARAGEGRVAPNPPVGCILVNDGKVIGGGWHDRLGGLHAEAMALSRASEAARGAAIYVTLSPCTKHGRQPPCADALIRAGVAEVVVAATDPNPGNNDGLAVLAAAGVRARAGILREEAEYLARGFFKAMRTGLPHVTLKYAMTLDGKIATAAGDSKWVSSPASREVVQDMRSRHDAVLTGIGTALADDPLLNVRGSVWEQRCAEAADSLPHRQPARVVVDSCCRLPVSAAMLPGCAHSGGREGGQVIVACVAAPGDDRREGRAAALRDAGAEVWEFPADEAAGARVPLPALLRRLAAEGMQMVLAECGGALAGGLFREGLVDEVAAFIAPKIVGGADAPGPVGGAGLTKMADAAMLRRCACAAVGDDLLLTALVHNASAKA